VNDLDELPLPPDESEGPKPFRAGSQKPVENRGPAKLEIVDADSARKSGPGSGPRKVWGMALFALTSLAAASSIAMYLSHKIPPLPTIRRTVTYRPAKGILRRAPVETEKKEKEPPPLRKQKDIRKASKKASSTSPEPAPKDRRKPWFTRQGNG